MYFDWRLWDFTKGVRGRIAGAVAVGLFSSALGVARLALLGWLLGLVLSGTTFGALVPAAAVVVAVIAARGLAEYWRIMIAHGTAARVQLHLREKLYDKIVALGPPYFGQARTGEVMVSLIDGVEHLEVYFGQYLPQLLVAAVTPLAIFGFVAFLDLPVAAVFLAAALITLIAPSAFHRWDRRNSLARAKAYGEFAAEFLDSIQGLATLKAFGQSGARARLLAHKAHELFRSTMWVLATNSINVRVVRTQLDLEAKQLADPFGALEAEHLQVERVKVGDLEGEVGCVGMACRRFGHLTLSCLMCFVPNGIARLRSCP